jgi:hypothetical protein
MAASSSIEIRQRSRSIPALALGPADTADLSTPLRRCVTCRKQFRWLQHAAAKRINHIFHEIQEQFLSIPVEPLQFQFPNIFMPRQ